MKHVIEQTVANNDPETLRKVAGNTHTHTHTH
jgi:hypothetical protein